MSRGVAWTDRELAATVDEYFRMHDDLRAGREVNKRAVYRQLHARFEARTAKAFELKFQNVSACLSGMGLPWVTGLAPLRNVQAALQDLVAERVRERASALSAWATSPASPAADSPAEVEFEPPPAAAEDEPLSERAAGVARFVDFAAIEARNRSLGEAGEQWALAFERRRLAIAGRVDLAERVVHASKTEGDGLGYDIRSFDPVSERVTLIEVKTTRGGPTMPFYLTAREVLVSREHAASYALYRVHSFGLRTRIYRLTGDLQRACELEPTAFRARPGGAPSAIVA